MSVAIGAETPVAIVLAGGSGSRSGAGRPKQLLDLHGRPVFIHAVDLYVGLGHHVIVVAAEDVRDEMAVALSEHLPEVSVDVVTGGRNRRLSIVAGVMAVPDVTADDTAVILHNAASPNTPPSLVDDCLRALDGHDAVQPFVSSDVTTILHEDGALVGLVPRATSGFTTDPTVYRRRLVDEIARAITAEPDGGETTLDIAVGLGASIRLIESPVENLKITLPGDLERVSRSMERSRRESAG